MCTRLRERKSQKPDETRNKKGKKLVVILNMIKGRERDGVERSKTPGKGNEMSRAKTEQKMPKT